MEIEFKKAVDLYENNKLNDAKKICLKIRDTYGIIYFLIKQCFLRQKK